jgi:hypothetical protein
VTDNRPLYFVHIHHSHNKDAEASAAAMLSTMKSITDAQVYAHAEPKEWWSDSSNIVRVEVSYTPFGDDDNAIYTRTREFADRLSGMLGTDVGIYNNID